jgi:hypothetical protein
MKSICPHCIHNKTKKSNLCYQRETGIQIISCKKFEEGRSLYKGADSKRARKIAEKLIGRKLRSNECVHHVNGNHFDNRSKNILVCTFDKHYQIHSPIQQKKSEDAFLGSVRTLF